MKAERFILIVQTSFKSKKKNPKRFYPQIRQAFVARINYLRNVILSAIALERSPFEDDPRVSRLSEIVGKL